MKPNVILALLALSLPSGAASASETWREQSRRTVPAQGLSTVAVENARGRIEARPSPDADIHVTAIKIARSARMEEARTMARETVVELSREGERYLVRVRYPRGRATRVNLWEGFESIGLPRIEVRVTVEVPRRVGVDLAASSGDLYTYDLASPQNLRASSGDVSVEGAQGSLTIATSSGDVSVRDARVAGITTSSGDVEVHGVLAALGIHSGSGDITVAETRDSLRIETSSGDVSVKRGGRDVTLRTSSGEIRLTSASGRVDLSSVSGDVVAGLREPLVEVSAGTSSGDIRIGLGERVACQLELRTTSGSLEVEVPLQPSNLTRRQVTGTVRGGRAPVTLRSSSGSIAVVSGEP